ncbi:MAG: tetratricopeptide repeat protein [Tepidanaerobacteraceae bacterium]|jgi:tetratricopeptide (TPR) repeat protein|nr:tetratricopeptide repeat protein [Tepidanaerobacteraceae bacterium]
MRFKKFAAFILSAGLILAGCGMLPSPSSTIKAPRVVSARAEINGDIIATAQEYLPPGAKLAAPSGTDTAIFEKDLDFSPDGKSEILVTYKVGDNPPEIGAYVLRQKDGKWQKVWQQQGFGYALDHVGFANLCGDFKPEVLIGGTIGASAGNGLDIFSWQDGTLKKIASMGYHKLDVLHLPGKYGTEKSSDGRAQLAVWQKDTGTAMMVDVLRWYEIGLVPAEDLYPEYFPKVVEYYQQQIKAMPDALYLWYYLADAQQKAGMPQDALKSVERGLSLKGDYPPEYEFEMVKGKALNDLGEYEEAISVFNDVLKAKANVPKPAGGQQPDEPAFLKRVKAEALLNMGKSYEGLKQYEKAEDYYKQSLDMTKSLFKDSSNGQISEDQLLAMFPADKALRRLKGIKGYERISQYLATLKPEERWQKLNNLDEWGKEQNIAINHLEAEAQDGGLLQTLLVDFTTDPESMGAVDGHAIFWWDKDKFHFQVFYSADEDAHGFSQAFTAMKARLSPGENNTVEMGVIYDSAAGGSGSPVPEYRLFRLEEGKWKIIWSSSYPLARWPHMRAEVSFVGYGLSELAMHGDLWGFQDGKEDIFWESNPGPHRLFQAKWTRDGDGYGLTEFKVLASAYSSLVDFVYDISTGKDAEAEQLVTDKALIDRAKELKLVQDPLGQRWQIDLDDPSVERRGPIKIISGPATGVEIHFIEKDGRFLISKINKRL